MLKLVASFCPSDRIDCTVHGSGSLTASADETFCWRGASEGRRQPMFWHPGMMTQTFGRHTVGSNLAHAMTARTVNRRDR